LNPSFVLSISWVTVDTSVSVHLQNEDNVPNLSKAFQEQMLLMNLYVVLTWQPDDSSWMMDWLVAVPVLIWSHGLNEFKRGEREAWEKFWLEGCGVSDFPQQSITKYVPDLLNYW